MIQAQRRASVTTRKEAGIELENLPLPSSTTSCELSEKKLIVFIFQLPLLFCAMKGANTAEKRLEVATAVGINADVEKHSHATISILCPPRFSCHELLLTCQWLFLIDLGNVDTDKTKM